MAEPTLLQFPFAGGVNEKIAAEYLDPTQQLASVVNGNFTKNGQIDKRLGIKALCTSTISPSGYITGTGISVGTWSRSHVAAAVLGQLYTVSSGGVANAVGPLPNVYSVRRPITNAPSDVNPTLVDVPYNGKTRRVSVVQDLGGNFVASVVDADTGDLIKPVTTIFPNPGGTYPPQVLQAMYLPNATPSLSCIITFINANTGQISCVNYNPLMNSFTGSLNLVTTSGPADATPFNGDPSGGFILFYASGGQLILQYLLPDLTLAHQEILTALPGTTTLQTFNASVVATYGAGEKIWLLYSIVSAGIYDIWVDCYSGDKNWTRLSYQKSTAYFGTTQRYLTGACRYDANTVLYGYTYIKNLTGGAAVSIGSWVLATTAGATTTGDFPFGLLPMSTPFQASDGSFYQAFSHTWFTPAESTYGSSVITCYLCKWLSFAGGTNRAVMPVATIAPRQLQSDTFSGWAQILARGRVQLASVSRQSQTRYAVGLRTRGNDRSEQDAQFSRGNKGPSWAVDFYFDSASCARLYRMGEIGSSLSISGSVPFTFDSVRAYEHGFFHDPQWASVSSSGTGGTLTGTYRFAIVYAFVDSAGAIHRSAPYITNSVDLTGGLNATVRIPALAMTWRDYSVAGQVFAEIFRTTSNGSTFYFLDRLTVSGGTSEIITYAAPNETDANLSVSSLLYTTGGRLSNANPPSFGLQCIHRGRIAGVDETLRTVWFSQRYSPGEAPGFSDLLTVEFPDNGDITAVATLDDAFVVFKTSAIYVMFGDGPADNNQGSDWTIPQALASDVGCIEPRSVVVSDAGVFFQATSGIHVLTRARSVEYIGRNVESTLAQYPVITSATVVPASTQVRFTCTDAAGANSVTIVYDYESKCWGKHVYSSLSAVPVGACMTQSTQRYTLIASDGSVWQEQLPSSATAYRDTNASGVYQYVTTTVTTGWIRLSGLQGFLRLKRVLLLAEQTDLLSGASVSFAFNYDQTVKQSASWTTTDLSPYAIVQTSVHVAPPYVRAESMQVTVSDALAGSGSNAGSGLKFTGIAVEAVPTSSRFRRIPPALRR